MFSSLARRENSRIWFDPKEQLTIPEKLRWVPDSIHFRLRIRIERYEPSTQIPALSIDLKRKPKSFLVRSLDRVSRTRCRHDRARKCADILNPCRESARPGNNHQPRFAA